MAVCRFISAMFAASASCLIPLPSFARSIRMSAMSGAQVVQMLDQASTNRTAQQLLTAYLAGIGEAAGAVIDSGGAKCQRPLTLAVQDVRRAIITVSGAQQAKRVAATPLIVRDMLARAGCRRR